MKKPIFILTLILIINQTLMIDISRSQWTLQNSGTTNALYDMKFINDKTGWCCGDGVIIKTTNGGTNWIQQTNGVPFETFFGIHPVDSNVVYAVGFFRTFIKSTDGGLNWITLESGGSGTGSYMSVFFINSNTGWISNWESPNHGVKKTIDGGITLLLYPFLGIPKDLYFKDSLNGIGVSGVAQIFKTTNGGINWIRNQLASTGDFNRISFINNNTGYVVSHKAAYKTTNFGQSWDSIGCLPSTNTTYGCEFSSENTGWVGTDHELFKTTNGGKDWILQMLTGVVTNIWAYNDSIVWTCGNGGRIWHSTTGGLVFINQISSLVPKKIILYQNYPNPFNPTTKINFAIPKSGFVTLKIYDILGREIKTLVNEIKQAGNYTIDFNASEFSSGVYFYRLESGMFREIKRMVLIK